jgi:hypothetical protein
MKILSKAGAESRCLRLLISNDACTRWLPCEAYGSKQSTVRVCSSDPTLYVVYHAGFFS